MNGTAITLSWNSGGGTTTGYKIAYQSGAAAPADCSSGSVVDVGTNTSHQVSDLSGMATYSFRVCAYNSIGTLSDGVATLSHSTTYPYGSYRRLIQVNNSGNANALTDYTIKVTLNTASLVTASHMKADCSDIRFTSYDSATLFSHWIESGCNTASTKIWVEVGTISANATTSIYAYYGDPALTSVADGAATFLFFDDFVGTTLDTTKWVLGWAAPTRTGYGSLNISGGWAELTGGDRYPMLDTVNTVVPRYQGVSIEQSLEVRDISFGIDAYNHYHNDLLGTAGSSGVGWLLQGTYNMRVAHMTGWDYTYNDGSKGLILGTTRYSTMMTENSIRVIGEGASNMDKTYNFTTVIGAGDTKLRIFGTYANRLAVDWIFIRKLSATEPSITVGAEE
ncbi:MAG: DUF2341 domain-containing protein [Bdellovibrionaceae bacterium]|nr:DUF2341 domain-containing protein [Pseudobdellovibrionaceae bacterium]